MSFKQKIYATISVLLILGYGIFSFLSYSSTKERITISIEDSLSRNVHNNMEQLQIWLQNISRITQSIANQIAKFDSNQTDEIIKFLHVGMQTTESNDVYVAYENDKIIDGSGWIPDASYKPTQRDWYKLTKQANNIIVTDPYIELQSNTFVVSVTAPIIKNGKFIGAVGTDVSLDKLVAMSKENAVEGGALLFLDNNGFVLGSSDEKQVSKKIKDAIPGAISTIDKIYAGNQGFLHYMIDDKKKIMVFDTMDMTRWKIVSSIYEDIAYKSVYDVFNHSLILSIFSIVISLAIIIFLLYILFKPLNRLGLMIKDLAVGEGDLTKRVEINGKDEIAKIGKDVNTFIQKIQTLIVNSKATSSENASVANELSQTSLAVGKKVEEESAVVNSVTKDGEKILN
ncbi:methyl-accepting chemotaxis protein, partial [Campylobacter sputorum]|uniref:methyl-accepting chemotaxis protein n=1 Tax=Campylobacter sputorum TaxID=206 RepID=UPI00187A4511